MTQDQQIFIDAFHSLLASVALKLQKLQNQDEALSRKLRKNAEQREQLMQYEEQVLNTEQHLLRSLRA